MEKQTVVHPFHGILLRNKRNELLSHKKSWRNLKYTLPSERIQSKKAIYCMIPTIRHSRKAKYRDHKHTGGRYAFKGREGGVNKWSTKDF